MKQIVKLVLLITISSMHSYAQWGRYSEGGMSRTPPLTLFEKDRNIED